MELEEGKLDLLPIEFRRVRIERNVAKRRSVTAGPAAMTPRSHHQHVRCAGIVGLDGFVRLQRPEQVFRVEPAADRHHRRFDVLQMRTNVARLPELVVRAVLHRVFPEGNVALEVLLVNFRQRLDALEELIAVGSAVIECRRLDSLLSAPDALGRCATSS